MQLTDIIKKPVLTEKTYAQMENGVYSFEVAFDANKHQIANAVEIIFKVKVAKVNTIKVDKKPKSVGRFHGFTNRYKKAIVTLVEGNTINFFPTEETAQKADEKAEAKKPAKKEVSDVEKRAAAKLANKKASASKAVKSVATKKTTTRKVGGE
ncbi:50S ribosomal protein L23 [Mycoplasmopsis alligatoris]|uniref:Large ribosomal subunit protein uL23 n=1 Tax=Mycoplasmopsis alligatoris A21JP2 TaxID=747682 RepID=D4XVJ3_9BACT|nr:50S ribosomal protein L23 [Mycoplasmopsis alligatoris]EFF41642.1 ribosomal protein L23 [Mycoplasmopsis alligatoris A21JP2]